MPRRTLDAMPDDARTWVFGSSRPLEAAEEKELQTEVDRFLDEWQAHGHALTCAGDWRYGRFLIVAVDERTAPPSGCSIDAMVGTLKSLGRRLGVDLVDNGPVWFRGEDGSLERVSRAAFGQAAIEGQVTKDTIVFDNTITRLSQVRAGGWERPAGDTWHGRAFRLR